MNGHHNYVTDIIDARKTKKSASPRKRLQAKAAIEQVIIALQ